MGKQANLTLKRVHDNLDGRARQSKEAEQNKKQRQRQAILDELDEAMFDASITRLQAALAAAIKQGYSAKRGPIAEGARVLQTMKRYYASDSEGDAESDAEVGTSGQAIDVLQRYFSGIKCFIRLRAMQSTVRASSWTRDEIAEAICGSIADETVDFLAAVVATTARLTYRNRRWAPLRPASSFILNEAKPGVSFGS